MTDPSVRRPRDRDQVPTEPVDLPVTPVRDDWNEGLDAYDKTIADSFPASDPPPGPLSI
ncbi:MAG: hypothetical protein GIX03_14480 [Candidatus Eremiobacteraeota bacterium]|nr:hypothetical protein [Candidatus Eremiobacteraeota bacterium]MBC5804816.1 hypothetical protein [Candidatus Eremiobacteraeota bacterium]MBC5824600.1 hypothetical protein [Candidatus Eremiobacteraeota bacterium]